MRAHPPSPPGRARRSKKFLLEEDPRLKALIAKYGTVSWDVIARQMPGRNPRQYRERWKHYLSSTRPKSEWSPAEDVLLYQKTEETGPRWTKLAQFFPGRTDLQVKWRWIQRFALVSNLHLRRPSHSRTVRLTRFPSKSSTSSIGRYPRPCSAVRWR
jgi:hypothetical protein